MSKITKIHASVYEVETYDDDRRVEAVLPDYRVAFTMRQDPSNGSWLEARSEVLSGTASTRVHHALSGLAMFLVNQGGTHEAVKSQVQYGSSGSGVCGVSRRHDGKGQSMHVDDGRRDHLGIPGRPRALE